jgi:hypothetical protein
MAALKIPTGLDPQTLQRFLQKQGLEIGLDNCAELTGMRRGMMVATIKQLFKNNGVEPAHRVTDTDTADDEPNGPLVEKSDLPTAVRIKSETYTLGSLIDGLSTWRSYLVIALSADCMICIRRLTNNEFKVKFYPEINVAGFDEAKLKELGAKYFSRTEEGKFFYSRIILPFVAVLKLLDVLRSMPTLNVIEPRDMAAKLPMDDLRANIEEWQKLSSYAKAVAAMGEAGPISSGSAGADKLKSNKPKSVGRSETATLQED